MIDTITLVGRAPSTRHLIEQLGEDDIIYTIGACWDIVPHIDAAIEIHPHWLLKHKNYSPPMYAWMQEPRDYPLYMQKAHAELPGSVAFPFDEVMDLAPVMRESGKRNKFLTSSFDYLMGLAILQKPRRIRILGFDMASNTEYRYQRPGSAFWCGIAAGRGIEVLLPDETPILAADMLYGYEGAQAITAERINSLRDKYMEWLIEANKDSEDKGRNLPKVEGFEISEDVARQYGEAQQARDFLFVVMGGAQVIEHLQDKDLIEGIVHRQALESHRNFSTIQAQNKLSFLNFWQGLATDRQHRLRRYAHEDEERWRREMEDAYKKQQTARDEYMMWKGGLQLVDQFINECDFKYNDDWKPSAETVSQSVEVVN